MTSARHLRIVATSHGHRALRASVVLLAVCWTVLGFASASRADVVINELRGSGTAADDDYVELFNRGSAPVNMLGWRVDARAGDDGAAGTVVLPGQTIAPRGKLLVTAPGYSLSALGASNDTMGGEVPAGGSVALIDPSNATQDAVRFAAGTVFGEGGPVGSFAPGGQYAFVRRANRTGTGDAYGLPTDSGDNAADFALVVPQGATSSAGSALPSIEGVPGPENLSSPPLANGALRVGRLDPAVATNVAPNRQIADPDGAGGKPNTLYLRRTITNISGAELTAVQFRVTTITTARSDSQAGQSIIRLDSSDNTTVAGMSITPVSLERSLQTPLTDGGGLNAVVSVPSVTPVAPLAPGGSIQVEFALRIAQPGAFQVILNAEAKRANDAPTDIALTGNSVEENQPPGAQIGTFSTTDPDANDTHSYSLVAGTGDADNGAFQIVGDTLFTNATFDFETKSSYSIRVRSTDDGAPAKSVEKVFTVNVTDANDPPSDISLSNDSVDENQPAGTTVGTLSAADQDSGQTQTFALATGTGDTDNGAFQITGSTLQTNQSFNFEAKSSYSIRVRATDNGSPAKSVEKVFTITVNDVNDPPTDIALSNTSVDENQPSGTAVGLLSTTDQDAADSFTYSLVTGTGDTDNGAFQITGNTLRTSQSFNFEAKSSYAIRVRSTDSGNQTTEKQFTITINNVNDAPTDIALSNSSVAENQPSGTNVGTFSTTDQDAGDTFTYSLVSGAGSTDNAAFQISGSTLQTNQSFNFEAKSSYSIRVRSTDSGNGSTEKQFAITITNANDAPTDIAISNANVNENQPSGTNVGTFSTTDEDAGDTFSYSLVSGAGSNDNGAFQITGNTLKTNQSFNFEVKNSYSIRVRSTDSGGQNTEKQFTITINDINDPPVPGGDSSSTVGNTLLAWGGSASVPAGQAGKDVTSGNVLSNDTDEDAGQTLSMDLASSSTTTPNGGSVTWFSDGSFRYTPAANFTGSDTLTYRVTDGQASVAGTVTISVAGKVWYVKNNQAAGGTGRSTDPFDTLVEAQTASAAGEPIYVFKGDGTTTGQNTGIALKSNQRLLGEPVTLVVGADTLYTGVAANRPAMSGNPGVKLATGSTVQGLDIAGSSGPAVCAGTAAPCTAAGVANGSTVSDVNLTGNNGGFNLVGGTGTFTLSKFSVTTTGGTGLRANNAGTLTVPSPPTTTVSSTGGPAVDIQSTGGSVVLDSATSTNSPGAGINLDSNGAGTFSGAAGSITGAAGNAVDINAGSGDITYAGTLGDGTGNTADITGRTGGAITLSGNINDTNDTGGGITMSGNTGGSTTFSGTTKTLNTGTGNAFSSTGTGQTINLTNGGLDIDTTGGNGLSATGGGTINVTTGTNPNTIDTGSGTALTVTSTSIGASGLTFRSIADNAGPNGIVLNTPGSSGGLSVTGTGTTAGSGGTIQGVTNRGVSAISTVALSLANMNFTNDGSANGADPTIATSTCGDLITGSNTGCNAAIHMDGISGSASLTNLAVSGGNQIGINGNNVSNLTLSNSTIQNAGDQTREDGVRFRDLKGTSSITNSTLQGNEDNQLRIANGNGATGTLNISGSTFQNSTNPNGEYGYQLDTFGTGGFTTTIATSTFNNTRGGGLVATAQGSSTLNVTASGGTWHGNAGAISNFDSAIQIIGANSANVKFNIHDITNPIVGYGLNVIHTQTNSPGTESLQGQIINNVIGDSSSNTSASTTGAGIGVNQQSTSNVKVKLSGNTIRGVATFGITTQMGNLTTAATNMDAIVQNNNISVTNTATALQGIFFNSGTTSTPAPGDAGTFCADVSGNVASSVNADGLRLRQRFATTVQLPGYAGGASDTAAVNTYLAGRNTTLGDTISSSTQSPGSYTNATCDAPTLP